PGNPGRRRQAGEERLRQPRLRRAGAAAGPAAPLLLQTLRPGHVTRPCPRRDQRPAGGGHEKPRPGRGPGQGPLPSGAPGRGGQGTVTAPSRLGCLPTRTRATSRRFAVSRIETSSPRTLLTQQKRPPGLKATQFGPLPTPTLPTTSPRAVS